MSTTETSLHLQNYETVRPATSIRSEMTGTVCISFIAGNHEITVWGTDEQLRQLLEAVTAGAEAIANESPRDQASALRDMIAESRKVGVE